MAQVGKDTIQLHSVEILQPTIVRNQSQMPLTNLKYQSGKRLSDMLSELSSVYVKSYGVGQLASIAVRGTSASQTEIQWNGIRMNQPTLGQNDLSLFALGMQDEVGITSSSGTAAIGGVLAMNNNAKFCNCSSAEGTLRYGSFNTFQGYGGLQYGRGIISGSTKVSYISAANNFKYRNDYKPGRPYETQKNSNVKLLSFIQQFNAKIDTHNHISIYLWLSEADRQLSPIVSKPYSKERQEDEAIRVMVQWKAKYVQLSGSLLELGFTTAYINEKLLYINPEANLNALTRTQVVRNTFISHYSIRGFDITGNLNYDYEQASVAAYQQIKKRNLGGVQINARYVFNNNIAICLGLRQDILNKQASPFSPSLSIGYVKKINVKHSIYLSLQGARAFRFATFNDLYWVPGGNPDLKTEKSWKGELSFLYNYNSIVNFSATGFCNYVDDWIQWIPQGTIWSAVNYKRVLSRGFEAAINATNTNLPREKFKVDFRVSYSFTKTTGLDGLSAYDQSKGKQLIYVPLHNVAAGLQLQYYRFYIRSTNNYVSTLYTSTDNSQALKGFFISNLEVGKDFVFGPHEVGASFRINNVGNADYQSVAQRPMPGRAYEGILRFKFASK